MRKSNSIMARIMVVAACVAAGIFFFQQINRPDSWQFYAALAGLLIFVGFAVLIFRKTS
ncbi:hypothetical protein [Nonlabens antarcticus]|uniref:hypothetical protein n=1 Tax=Nonlabens antarcticus TaxID=392714 RepID=UPI0018917671|nr:hypothetical protein [Nonlabens antarcticus]